MGGGVCVHLIKVSSVFHFVRQCICVHLDSSRDKFNLLV